MGQQQLLLIILGVIVVGFAIAVGISMFGSGSIQSNRDALVNDLNNLASTAYQFKIRPANMGGGGHTYTGGGGFTIPAKLLSNDNGVFSTTTVGAQKVSFEARSAQGYGNITADCDSMGKLTNFVYSGDFQ